YDAVFKGVQRYISRARAKISKLDGNEDDVVLAAFKDPGAALSVTTIYDGYENSNTGAKIADKTKSTIARGNRLLAQAMLAAFRNPIAHQENEDLKNSDIYSAKDCLDALSLLSHLFRRLDNAELN
ncbi:MAG: TIGR02391 family protein, partial [Mariprofundaceae bacterium]